MKLDRKQDLNILYQVCVFQADQKIKMAALASDWLRHFLLLLWNRLMEFNKTLQEERSTSSTKFVLHFYADRINKMVALASDSAEQNSTKLVRKQDINVLCQVCVFRADHHGSHGNWLAK